MFVIPQRSGGICFFFTEQRLGFTLIELLIVMSIMLILMALAVPNMISSRRRRPDLRRADHPHHRPGRGSATTPTTTDTPVHWPLWAAIPSPARPPPHPPSSSIRCSPPRDRSPATPSPSPAAPRSPSTTRTCTTPTRSPAFLRSSARPATTATARTRTTSSRSTPRAPPTAPSRSSSWASSITPSFFAAFCLSFPKGICFIVCR